MSYHVKDSIQQVLCGLNIHKSRSKKKKLLPDWNHFGADFAAKLTEAGSNLVVVDFFATWCGPCKMIAPKIEEFAARYPDVTFLKVDVDECEEVAEEYNISSMPTFVFIKNQVKVDSFSGANAEMMGEYLLRLK